MYKKLILSTALIFFCCLAYAQSFYISSSGLIRVTLNRTGYTTKTITGCSLSGTIALYKNTLYSTFGGSITQSTIVGDVTTDCKTLTTLPAAVDGVVGMTVDQAGVLYLAAGYDLYRVDPKTKIVELLGTMPYRVAGDFIFSEKQLYMASTDGIVKVDIVHPELSTMIIPISGSVFGMASVLDFDGKIKVYALLTAGGTDMLQLDLVNNKIVKTAYHLAEFVGDAASDVESGVLTNTLTITEQCDNPGKGQIQVTATSDKRPVYFSLNGGVADTVGLYQNLSAGNYNIKITSPDTVLNTTATVPDYSANRPVVTTVITNAKCEINGQVQFNIADDASNYLLKFNNDTTALTKPVTGLLPGKYQFKVLRSNGCLYGIYDVVVGRTKCEIIIAGVAVNQQCDALLRGTVTVNTPAHAYPYTYTLEQVTNGNGKFDNVTIGDHQIRVTSAEDTVLIPVNVPDYKLLVPAFSVSQKAELCDLGGEIKFDNAGNNKLFQIRMNDGSAYPFNYTFGKLHTGTYRFTFIDDKGCIVDTASVFLEQLPCSPVAFPNTFTPNGDGTNDLFRPNLDGYARQYMLHIYGRTGQEVFTSTDYFTGWPGTIKGKYAPAAVYYWVVSFINDKQKPVTQKGWVTLLR